MYLKIFSNKIDITGITDLNILKEKLLKEKIIHNKYRYKILSLTFNELKNFVYTGILPQQKFDGVATIFTSIIKNDLKHLIKYILECNLNSVNILRIMFYCIENDNKYDGILGLHIRQFKMKYLIKFKKLLFDLGQLKYIDKLDLINLFVRLLNCK